MVFCKNAKCENCYAIATCVNIPAHTEQEVSDLHVKVAELKRMAEMMEVDPRLLIEALRGS